MKRRTSLALGRLGMISMLVSACASQAGPRATDAVPPPVAAQHQHLISPAFGQLIGQPVYDGRALLRDLDRAGIDRGVVLSVGYSFADERKKVAEPDRRTREENDWTSRQVIESKGRLIGFCSVNPLRDEALAEVDRCLQLPGIVGLKLHFANSGVSLRNPAHVARMRAVFAAANAHHSAIVVHMRARSGNIYGAEDARTFIDQLLPATPDVPVQIAHLAGSGEFPNDAEAAMTVFAGAISAHDPRVRHLIFDACSVASPDTTDEDGLRIARAIRGVGVERVVFGSDLPIGGNPPPAESWAIFLSKVKLTAPEFRTIARNLAPYLRKAMA